MNNVPHVCYTLAACRRGTSESETCFHGGLLLAGAAVLGNLEHPRCRPLCRSVCAVRVVACRTSEALMPVGHVCACHVGEMIFETILV